MIDKLICLFTGFVIGFYGAFLFIGAMIALGKDGEEDDT